MLILASLGALALAARWSPAARWMMGAVGLLGGIVATLALLAVLVRLLLVAGLSSVAALATTTFLWAQAGPFLAVAAGGLTFILALTVGVTYAFGRLI